MSPIKPLKWIGLYILIGHQDTDDIISTSKATYKEGSISKFVIF